MAVVSLPLPGNVLYTQPQTLEFDKIATFIGGNGSGKSTILKSIFDEKLKPTSTMYQGYKVVCFSSGQNESYSSDFSTYLGTERLKRNALNLDCFYYDKLWSKLLIFLATTSIPNGLVRSFLRQNNYVFENEIGGDQSTRLFLDVKVDTSYTNLVQQAKDDELNGDSDTIIRKAYHQTLHNFINSLIDENYDFLEPMGLTPLELTGDSISQVSFEVDEHASFDSKVMFFTQASDNNFFIVKDSFNLVFKKNDTHLRLEDLSDGEYQLLFLYALFDLFDSENTLFLLDEADSHLHYKNIDKLWTVFNEISGKAITTTHLLDSISKSGLERLKVVEDGEVKAGKKISYLASRLKDLSEINNTQLKAMSIAENIVFIDDEDDWEIFKLLAIKKLASNSTEEGEIKIELGKFIVIKQESGYEKNTQIFGDSKLKRLKNFAEYIEGHVHNTKNIYLICDRDEFSLTNIGTEKCNLLVQQGSVKRFNKNKLTSHLLSWKRREIKHYLISPTALQEDVGSLNDRFDLGNKTKLVEGNSGDYDTDGNYNNKLAALLSESIKQIIDPYVKTDVGFCVEKTQEFVSRIPKDEISEDIVNMYNYLVPNNE